MAIDEELAAGTIKRKAAINGHVGPFLDGPNRPLRTPPRGATSDDARHIEHIWIGELESGLMRVIGSCFGIDREEALMASARAFGFHRVGGTIREALSAALDSLIEAGRVTETDATLKVKQETSSPPTNDQRHN